MASESALNTAIRAKSKTLARLSRVENLCEPGMPDLFFISQAGRMGWIESKQVDHWPKRGGVLNIGLREAQMRWHVQHCVKWNGNSFILAQIARDYVLYSGSQGLELFLRKEHVRPIAQSTDLRQVLLRIYS